MSIADTLALRSVEVRHKRTSRLMRVLTTVLGIFGLDFGRFWTTIGSFVIYAPDDVDLGDLEPHATIIRHELVHIDQARRFPGFFQLSYLLLPLPFGLAYFRWVWERRAYLVDIEAGRLSIEEAVTTLWSRYGWCWPRPWMRRWFLARARLPEFRKAGEL